MPNSAGTKWTWIGAFSLAFCLSGCATASYHSMNLEADSPSIVAVGAGKKIVLGEFSSDLSPLASAASDNGEGFGGNIYNPSEAPEKMLRDKLSELLSDAAFAVVHEGGADSSALSVEGVVERFSGMPGSIHSTPVGNAVTYITEIRFKLIFKRAGQVVETREIAVKGGSKTFHGFFSTDDTQFWTEAFSDGLKKALLKTARYISSEGFQINVLGVSPDKVRHIKDDADEDEGGDGAKESE